MVVGGQAVASIRGGFVRGCSELGSERRVFSKISGTECLREYVCAASLTSSELIARMNCDTEVSYRGREHMSQRVTS
jgi:hypothetical protein